MYEGSEHHVHGGLLENVEARNCQGCFSGYPANGLTMINNTCADSVCRSSDPPPPKGFKRYVNHWSAGDNARDDVFGTDVRVLDSYSYEDPENCPNSEWRYAWEAHDGIFTDFEVTQLDTWTPREPIVLEFDWSECDISPP